MKLSQNFSLKELVASQTADRKGIDNTPTDEHIENLKLLCENVLQPVRDEWGVVSVSSGYRSPSLCLAIGSSEKSQHARGQAADFECYSVDNRELFDWITQNLEFFYGENQRRDNVNSYAIVPKEGDMFIFPAFLTHFVYPFRSKNVKRISIAANFD